MSTSQWRVAPFTGAWIENWWRRAFSLAISASHPSRVRGLKITSNKKKVLNYVVAPFTGAWIEKLRHSSYIYSFYIVAPFTGAWIENVQEVVNVVKKAGSHPSRVRGLKSHHLYQRQSPYIVAPFTGAWIENTTDGTITLNRLKSHPSRVRGLKTDGSSQPLGLQESHPSRVRGLKCRSMRSLKISTSSRTLHGCVD